MFGSYFCGTFFMPCTFDDFMHSVFWFAYCSSKDLPFKCLLLQAVVCSQLWMSFKVSFWHSIVVNWFLTKKTMNGKQLLRLVFVIFFNIMDYTTGTSYGPHLGRLVNHGRKDERTVRMKIFEVDVLFLRCVCLLWETYQQARRFSMIMVSKFHGNLR